MIATGNILEQIDVAVRQWYEKRETDAIQQERFINAHRKKEEFDLLMSSSWFTSAVLRTYRALAFQDLQAVDVLGEPVVGICLAEMQMQGPVHLVGEGAYGSVYQHPKKKSRVLKVIDNPNMDYNYILREVEITRVAADLGVAPRFYNAYTCCGTNHECMVLIEMQMVQETLADWLVRKPRSEKKLQEVSNAIQDLLSRLHQRGIVHHDIHMGNILIGKGDRVFIIDYGRASMGEAANSGDYSEEILREGAEWIQDSLNNPSRLARLARNNVTKFVASYIVSGGKDKTV